MRQESLVKGFKGLDEGRRNSSLDGKRLSVVALDDIKFFVKDKKLSGTSKWSIFTKPSLWLFTLANFMIGMVHQTGYFFLPRLGVDNAKVSRAIISKQ